MTENFKYCVGVDRNIYYGQCFDTEEEAKNFVQELRHMDTQNNLLAFLGRNPDGSRIE